MNFCCRRRFGGFSASAIVSSISAPRWTPATSCSSTLSYGNGRMSEDESSLLGRMMLADIFLSCLGRPEGSTEVLVIIDECQRYLTRDIASILDQARKFGLSLVLAHQHLGHLREAGEHIFRSVMTNARTKIVFGGLDDDDATLMARNLFRGTLDLEMPKQSFDRPTVIGQEFDWLASESEGRGTARAEGTTWSEGESVAQSRSATTSWGRTVSDSIAASRSTTRSRSKTKSASETDQWSHTDSRSSGTSASDTRSSSTARSTGITQDFVSPYRSRGSRLRNPEPGATISDNDSGTEGIATTTGRSNATGAADSFGGARATGRATTRGTAETTGAAHTRGVATTEGIAITEGITHSTSRSWGGSATDTVSRSNTTGRSQTLRSIYETKPTQAYSLQELQYLGSSLLGSLGVGEAIAKIGERPPVRLKTLRIKSGWASEAQVERLKQRLAALASPFVTPLPGSASDLHRLAQGTHGRASRRCTRTAASATPVTKQRNPRTNRRPSKTRVGDKSMIYPALTLMQTARLDSHEKLPPCLSVLLYPLFSQTSIGFVAIRFVINQCPLRAACRKRFSLLVLGEPSLQIACRSEIQLILLVLQNVQVSHILIMQQQS